MNLTKYFPWFNEAWKSYTQCRTVLWWPLSFLFLTPLAVLIVFGVIIPCGLNVLGWISFDHPILNYPYLLIVAGLVFAALFPFLDGVYQLIKAHLEGRPINENTGFLNLLNSQGMAKAIGPVFVALLVLELLSSLFKPFNILFLMAQTLTIFTPIFLVNDKVSPWKKGLESVEFTLQNKKLVAKICGLRILILLSLVLPWKLIALTGGHTALKAIMILFAIPSFGYLVVKVLPFYFFYPAYVYKQLSTTNVELELNQ